MHIEHIDDYAFTGETTQGVDALYSLIDAINNKEQKHLTLSTKYDGSPAIVFGIHPENKKFFCGTKSVFNKKIPKLIYREEDISIHYGYDADLANKMSVVFKRMEHNFLNQLIPHNQVYHGDLMFIRDDIKTDGKFLSFTPNTITYSIESKPYIDQFMDADFGIAVHTAYEGTTLKDMTPTGTIDHSQFVQWAGVIWFNPELIPNHFKLDQVQTFIAGIMLDRSETLGKLISDSLILIKHEPYLKKFINHCIKIGENNPSEDMYKVYLVNRELDDLAKEYNHPHILAAISARFYLDYAKLIIMSSLDMGAAFIHTVNGKITAGEGYVLKHNGRIIKLINRIEFSRLNFANQKYMKVK